MVSNGKDGFDVVRRRRTKPELISCTAPGCSGKCPRHVIEQGLRGFGYAPAKCYECGRQYRTIPGGTPAARDSGKPGADQSASAKRVQALEQEVKKLRQQVQAPEVKARGDASGEAAASEDPATVEAKAIQNRISTLRACPKTNGTTRLPLPSSRPLRRVKERPRRKGKVKGKGKARTKPTL